MPVTQQVCLIKETHMHPTPQYDTLKDVDKVLPTLLPELKNMLPCQFTHQNVEGAIYCSECHPNGPDFD